VVGWTEQKEMQSYEVKTVQALGPRQARCTTFSGKEGAMELVNTGLGASKSCKHSCQMSEIVLSAETA
jgi:hypothetical protein